MYFNTERKAIKAKPAPVNNSKVNDFWCSLASKYLLTLSTEHKALIFLVVSCLDVPLRAP